MDALLIEGPAKLHGSVTISGSKNSALPLLFSSLLFDGEVKFTNVPRLWDVETTLHLLADMGTTSEWNKEQGTLSLFPKIEKPVAAYEWVKKMRAGILALGPLVAKFGEAKVSLPGGCAIGARPVNFHLEALRKMGVTVTVEEGYIKAQAEKGLQGGAVIDFPQVTVTGTENLLMAAVMANGITTLRNCAMEPEVTCLGEFLISAGAKIKGLGTEIITVEGGKLSTTPPPFEIPADRIETGTWIAIAVATRSRLRLEKCRPRELASMIKVYERMGVSFEIDETRQSLEIIPCEKYLPVDVITEPYPGFPTDMQAQLMVCLTQAEGTSHICETIFENRFMHVSELGRLGAKIELDGNMARIEGPRELSGAPVMATDLRASASLVIAALCAKGTTKISRIYHLDRGYQRLEEKLRPLGAKIERYSET